MALGPDELAQLNMLIYQPGFIQAYESVCREQRIERPTLGQVLDKMAADASNGGQHDAWTSDEQYRNLIECLRNGEAANMTVADVTQPGTEMGGARQTSRHMTLTDEDGNMYVVFEGTEGGEGEWADNFYGLTETDTESQEAAAAYVAEMLRRYNPTGKVVVSGHSKGGNSAMYVAIVNPRVDDAYSFDGQGFGPGFLGEHAEDIARNRRKIHAYNYCGDFVSALLYVIAGDVHFVFGASPPDRIDSLWDLITKLHGFASSHAPSRLFSDDKCFTMRDGAWPTKYWRAINQLTIWIANNVPRGMQHKLVEFLGQLMAPNADAAALMAQNPRLMGALACVLASCPATAEALADAGPLADLIAKFVKGVIDAAQFAQMLGDLLGVEITPEWVDEFLEGYEGMQKDVQDGVRAAEASEIKQVDIRDWSDERMEELLAIVAEVDAEPWWDFSRWDVWYRIEDLTGHLNIDEYRNDMETYMRKQMDMNGVSAERIRQAFAAAQEHDGEYARAVSDMSPAVQGAARRLGGILKG